MTLENPEESASQVKFELKQPEPFADLKMVKKMRRTKIIFLCRVTADNLENWTPDSPSSILIFVTFMNFAIGLFFIKYQRLSDFN